MSKIKIEMEIEVTDQDIDDIVCTAFEGGINYWCDHVEPVGDLLGDYEHEQIAKDGYLYLYDIEDDEEKWILTKSRASMILSSCLSQKRPTCATPIRWDWPPCRKRRSSASIHPAAPPGHRSSFLIQGRT